jgi:hypothetical protein
MKTPLPWILLAIASLTFAVGGRVFAQEPAPAAVTGIPKYEYLVLDPDDKGGDGERRERLQAQLTPLGREGWKVVEMPYLKGVRYQVIVLMRPAP